MWTDLKSEEVRRGTTSLYQFYDEEGWLLYVGVTDRGVLRFNEHNASKTWWQYVSSSEVTHYESRVRAELSEAEHIRNLCPLFNVAHNIESEDMPMMAKDVAKEIEYYQAGENIRRVYRTWVRFLDPDRFIDPRNLRILAWRHISANKSLSRLLKFARDGELMAESECYPESPEGILAEAKTWEKLALEYEAQVDALEHDRSRINGQAAKYRRRLREAEAERDHALGSRGAATDDNE